MAPYMHYALAVLTYLTNNLTISIYKIQIKDKPDSRSDIRSS